ncbi:hypothetical protein U1Q18_005772, partial [Sarracenia purpurea var. burkii]
GEESFLDREAPSSLSSPETESYSQFRLSVINPQPLTIVAPMTLPPFRLVDESLEGESQEEGLVSRRRQGDEAGTSGAGAEPSEVRAREEEGTSASASKDAAMIAFLEQARAQSTPSKINEDELDQIRRTYQIPNGVTMRVPTREERVCTPALGEIYIFEGALQAGMRLPFPPLVRNILDYLGISPGQLWPNGWRILLGCVIIWELEIKRSLTKEELFYCYKPME